MFANQNNLSIVIEHDPETGYNVRKIVMNGPLPRDIAKHLTAAINNTRNSFDQILFAACKSIGKPIKDAHFPWVDSEDALRWKFEHRETRKILIPLEFWDAIARQQPYPRDEVNGRGDTGIRSMATLANRKHTIGYNLQGTVARWRHGFTQAAGHILNLDIAIPSWDPIKNEIITHRWRGGDLKFSDDDDISLYVALDPTAPAPLIGSDALAATLAFIQAAQRALNALKASAVETLNIFGH